MFLAATFQVINHTNLVPYKDNKKCRFKNKQNMEPWKHCTETRMYNSFCANRNNNLEAEGSGGKSGTTTQPGYLRQISLVGIKELS